jgi:hypothetical protein
MENTHRIHNPGQGGVMSGVEKHLPIPSPNDHVLFFRGDVAQGSRFSKHIFNQKVQQWATMQSNISDSLLVNYGNETN